MNRIDFFGYPYLDDRARIKTKTYYSTSLVICVANVNTLLLLSTAVTYIGVAAAQEVERVLIG